MLINTVCTIFTETKKIIIEGLERQKVRKIYLRSLKSIIRLIHQKMVQKCCLLLRMILLIEVSAHARSVFLVGRIPQEHCAEKSRENNWIRPVFSRMRNDFS